MAERVLDLDPATDLEAPPALLTRYSTLIEGGLRRSALPPGSNLGRMAAYHLGWATPDGASASATTGKRIRPALCLWACQANGGDAGWAIPGAVAVELI